MLAAILIGAAVIPGRASSQPTQHCAGPRCRAAGSILWTASLPGSWLAEAGVTGTVPSAGAAYAATGDGLAVLGAGLNVTALQASTGRRAWQAVITGLPPGSAIVGVRILGREVAVGVQPPPGQEPERDEVILSVLTGNQVRVYPAAAYGGAIAAYSTGTVILGPEAVTAYSNSTGRVLWSRGTGSAGQAWRVSGQYVYIAESSSSGVAAVRQISLSDGAERVLLPQVRSTFSGSLSAVVDGVLLFSDSDGVAAYNGQTGDLAWQRESDVLELTDPARGTAYLASGDTLTGVDVTSGTVLSRASLSVADSLYWVASGVALGLDQDALGDAWGYDLGTRRVIWTSEALPWPHFFADLSGLSGSGSPGGHLVLLATCARVGAAAASPGSPQPCLQPELAAVLT